jgi:formate hydrogenlyase subunit 3/multisubunit Na+/H+ antiporter MnhD subunit
VDSILPALAVVPALAAAPLIVATSRWPRLREAWSVLAALAQLAIVVAMLGPVLDGRTLVSRPFALAPGVPLELRADALGLLFALIAASLWVVTTVYSIGYVKALREHAQTRYFASFALCLAATMGTALAANLLTFVLFFELLTVATYPLVIHKETAEARQAGRVYLGYTLTGGAALLGATVWTLALTGRLDFAPGGILDGSPAGPATLWVLLALFVLGCGVKAAVLPLHTWLPLAMVAPTPVSALLHAVAVVKAGVFGLARVVGFVFGPALLDAMGAATALAALAGATILFGSLAALPQDNLKRLLAFSTVSQLSYVVLGLALGTPAAIAGGLFHIASHALLKITLFFCAGALHATAHVERIGEMRGIGRRMPVTMTVFAAAAAMLAGLPPGAAFISKWLLLTGAADAGAWPAIAVLLASTVLNVAYFAPVVLRAFGPGPPGPVREAPAAILVPLVLTALAGLLLGLAPDGWVPVQALAQAIAASVSAVR